MKRFIPGKVLALVVLALTLANFSAFAGGEHFTFLKTDNVLLKIAYADTLFAEAMENYVSIHTKDK